MDNINKMPLCLNFFDSYFYFLTSSNRKKREMNHLSSQDYRFALKKLSDLHVSNLEPLRPKRAFGRDITNLHEKKTKNSSIYEKIVPTKLDVKPRAKSLASKKDARNNLPRKDPLEDYKSDILQFMVKLGKMEKGFQQKEITEKMRQILVDWLVDVHESFQLKEQTLHLALSYLAQYTAERQITKEEYQLVGITCLWIASKYEEIYPPRTKNYIEVTADSYNMAQLKSTQGKIIETLDFNLNRTTTLHLLEGIVPESMDEKSLHFCKYILEACIFSNVNKNYEPSTIVMAVISLCESVFKKKLEVKLGSHKEGQKDQMMKCFKEICCIIEKNKGQELKAIRRKYTKSKYSGVAKISLSIHE